MNEKNQKERLNIKEIIEIQLEDSYYGKSIRQKFKYKKIIITKHGVKIMENIDKVNIVITKGVKENDIIKIENKGHIDENGNRGDLLYFVKIMDHKIFKTRNNDLYLENIDINLFECLTGTSLEIDFIDNKKKIINIDCIIDGKKIYKVNNLGMPIKDSNLFGDLYISFNIIYPNCIIDKKKLSEILGQDKRDIIFNKNEKIHNLLITSSTIMTKELIDKVGKFNMKQRNEDHEYWNRALEIIPYCLYIKNPLSYYDNNHGDGRLY